MLRNFFFTLLFTVVAGSTAFAQAIYYQVINIGGSVTYNATTTVSVASYNNVGSGPNCGLAYHYSIGAAPGGGVGNYYSYTFSGPVTAVRLQVSNFYQGDGLSLKINGSFYSFNASNFSAYNSPCGTFNTLFATGSGVNSSNAIYCTSLGGGQIDVTPAMPITTLSVYGQSNGLSAHPGCPNFYYDLFFTTSSCNALTTALADTPCTGAALHLSATTLAGATYSWSGPGGFASTLQNPVIPTVTAAAAGNYIVTITKDSCIYTDTAKAVIHITPGTPTASSNSPVCGPDTLKLTSASTGAAQYMWRGPAGFTSALQSPFIPNAGTGAGGIYKVYTIGSTGCVSDTGYTTVQVFTRPTAGFTYATHYGCAQDTVVFTNTSVNGAGGSFWIFGDGSSSMASSPSHLYTTQGVFTVKLVSRSANSCADSISQQVVLNHPLQAAFATDHDSICQNGTVQFTNTSIATTLNGSPPSYTWLFGDGATSTALSPAHTYSAPGVYTVRLAAKNFVPCHDTATRRIVVDSLPYLSFIVLDSGVCAGTPIRLRSYYQSAGLSGLQWSFGDGATSTAISPAHMYAMGGNYTITLTGDYAHCPDSSYSRAVFIKDGPGVNLGPDTVICANVGPLRIYDHRNTAGYYSWSTGETGAGISVSAPGVFSVTKTIPGCGSASDTIAVSEGCVLHIPNAFTPNNDGLNDYFFPSSILSNGLVSFKMRIYNRWGQAVYTSSGQSAQQGWDGNMSGVPQQAGVYIYEIIATFDNGVTTQYKGNISLIR